MAVIIYMFSSLHVFNFPNTVQKKKKKVDYFVIDCFDDLNLQCAVRNL